MAFSPRMNGLAPKAEALELVEAQLAVRYGVLPLRIEGNGTLVVAMDDPADLEVLDELGLALQCEVAGERVRKSVIVEAIREYYGVGADTLEQLVDTRDLQVVSDTPESSIDDASTDASMTMGCPVLLTSEKCMIVIRITFTETINIMTTRPVGLNPRLSRHGR